MPVTAVRPRILDNDPRRVLGLHVKDFSRGGLGAIARERLQQEEALVLFLPPLGSAMGEDAAGQVVRCVPQNGYYELGIAFDRPLGEPDEGPVHPD